MSVRPVVGDTVQFWPEGFACPLAAIVLAVYTDGLTLRVLSPSGGRFDSTVERVPHGEPGACGLSAPEVSATTRGHWTGRG